MIEISLWRLSAYADGWVNPGSMTIDWPRGRRIGNCNDDETKLT
jgi:hypothetical protein